MFVYGFPISVGVLSHWILSASDKMIIKQLCDSADVGRYSVPYQVASQTLLLVTSLFYMADRPLSMQVWAKEGIDASKQLLTTLVRLYLIICIPLTVLLCVLAKPILQLVTSSDYVSQQFNS